MNQMKREEVFNKIKANNRELLSLLDEWEKKLLELPEEVLSGPRNQQDRNIRKIFGHMIDSASNNTHRAVHLQYRESPLDFPNYASNGNNDRWIAIQNYLEEDWFTMVQLWKYSNLHIIHVFENVNSDKLENQWYYDEKTLISLEEGILDYLNHFQLHLSEIEELINEAT